MSYWETWIFHCFWGNERTAEKKSTSEQTEDCTVGSFNTRNQTAALSYTTLM